MLKTQSNRTYDGSWENDLPHGFGVNTFPNGKIYKGEYKKGKPFGEVSGSIVMEAPILVNGSKENLLILITSKTHFNLELQHF